VPAQGSTGPIAVRVIADVETMRAMAEPTRIAILRLLMSGDKADPPVMSAKEIAAALQESQIKLYRHLKHLNAVGLIRVAETRMVSGIQEQRYQTGQLALTVGSELVADGAAAPALTEALVAMLGDFRKDLVRHLAEGHVPIGPTEDTPLGMVLVRGMASRVSPERAAEFRRRLLALEAEFDDLEGDDPQGIPVQLIIGWYAVSDPSAPKPT
jgi:DNA-binding transcriptional ArsR family regulator